MHRSLKNARSDGLRRLPARRTIEGAAALIELNVFVVRILLLGDPAEGSVAKWALPVFRRRRRRPFIIYTKFIEIVVNNVVLLEIDSRQQPLILVCCCQFNK